MSVCRRPAAGFTLIEAATVVVALVVMAAIAIPLWKSWQLRDRRDDAVDALLALQAAQDRHFAAHARYADSAMMQAAPPSGLGLTARSKGGHFVLTVQRSADQLGYVATARALVIGEESGDARCTEFRLDEHGRRSAVDAAGKDSTADCWNRI